MDNIYTLVQDYVLLAQTIYSIKVYWKLLVKFSCDIYDIFCL